MKAITVLLLFLALAFSSGIAWWFYLWRKNRNTVSWGLAMLRAATLFVVGLLLINPQFTKQETELIRPRLYVLADNSQSIDLLKGTNDLKEWFQRLKADKQLKDRFDLQTFTFEERIRTSDTLNFTGDQTDPGLVLSQLNELSKGQATATILLTDGNQNTGASYDFNQKDEDFLVYPIAVGDTTQYEDIRATQLILNKYAFLGNQYPVEFSWVYKGTRISEVPVRVEVDGNIVLQKSINTGEGTGRETFYITAEETGIKKVVVVLSDLQQEKNTDNNRLQKRIEIIDESVKVGLVSSIAHPDLGTLKTSLENGGQRLVEYLNPSNTQDSWGDYNLLILYQPNARFNGVIEYIKKSRTPSWLIGGTQTSWAYLNNKELGYQYRSLGQNEGVQAELQEAFSLFDWGNFDPSDYPPLEMSLGEMDFFRTDRILFNQKIRGIELNQPLLFFPEDADSRRAVLLGEGLWKWRMHSFRENQKFDEFDQAMSLIVRYLSASQKKDRLVVDYESIYRKGEQAVISARYFDPTFVFDPNASLQLQLESIENGESQRFPFALRSNRYELDLSVLNAGAYRFTVEETNSKRKVTGQFEILEFNLEQLSLFTQHQRLSNLAERNGGKMFFPSQWDEFKASLLNNNKLLPQQRSREIVVPLIQLKVLLFLLALLLAAEWFIRKYRGWS